MLFRSTRHREEHISPDSGEHESTDSLIDTVTTRTSHNSSVRSHASAHPRAQEESSKSQVADKRDFDLLATGLHIRAAKDSNLHPKASIQAPKITHMPRVEQRSVATSHNIASMRIRASTNDARPDIGETSTRWLHFPSKSQYLTANCMQCCLFRG